MLLSQLVRLTITQIVGGCSKSQVCSRLWSQGSRCLGAYVGHSYGVHVIISAIPGLEDKKMAGKDGYEKLGKLIEAGLTVAKIAQTKAEESLRDIVHISEVQRNQARELIEDAARRRKDSSESLLKSLRKEFEKQLKSANLISRDELAKFSEKLNSVSQELAKVSVLRDEVNRLIEILNTLMRLISKSDLQDHQSNSAPHASTGMNYESSPGKAESRPAPSRATAPKPVGRQPRVSSKPGGKATEPSAKAKPRTHQGTGDSPSPEPS